MSRSITTHALPRALCATLTLSSALISATGCDDDNAPQFSDGGEMVMVARRDMGMSSLPPADAYVPPVETDMTMTEERDMLPPIEQECTEGELRLLEPCGYERCRLGEWTTPSALRESCNDHDDDCDNNVDESFNVGSTCFTRSAEGCNVEGVFACNLETLSVTCEPGDGGPEMELCDGIDNDCDNRVDEDFPDELCCTENIHCPAGASCNAEGLCEGQTVNPTMPTEPGDPNNPIPTDGIGTCASPIRLQAAGFYSSDRSELPDSLSSVASCVGGDADALIVANSLLGKEAVFALNLPSARRVRLSTPFNFFDHIMHVSQGSCPGLFAAPIMCAESAPLNGEVQTTLELDVAANQTYYIVVDTTLNALGQDADFTLLFETL